MVVATGIRKTVGIRPAGIDSAGLSMGTWKKLSDGDCVGAGSNSCSSSLSSLSTLVTVIRGTVRDVPAKIGSAGLLVGIWKRPSP